MSFLNVNVWQLAGWTMVHFLWSGMIVGILAALGRLVLRSAPANVRYSFTLATFLALASLPAIIATWLPAQMAVLSGDNSASQVVDVLRAERLHVEGPVTIELSDRAGLSGAIDKTAKFAIGLSESREQLDATEQVEMLQGDSAPVNRRQSRGLTEYEPDFTRHESQRRLVDSWLEATVSFLDAKVGYLPWLWLFGTPLTFALLAMGVVGTKRLQKGSRPVGDGPINELLAHLASSLRIGQRVTIAVCDRIATPVLVGIVRPMILLPPAALAAWSPDEIEMVLLHELAHVRRWDNLVNLLQRLVESVLFFHPAVWLVSSWVRRERESCCDAVVVARTNRPHAYAEMLVALAAQMPRSVLFHPVASSAMAAGPLRSRIRQILKLDNDPMLISGKSFAILLASAVISAAAALLYLPTIGQAEESVKAKASTNNSSVPAGGEPNEFTAEDINSLAELFAVVGVANPTETRTYKISEKQRRGFKKFVNWCAQGPARSIIRFEQKWNEGHKNVEITAPQSAHLGFFEPVISSLGTPNEIKFSAITGTGIETKTDTPPVVDDAQAMADTQNNLKNIMLGLLNFEAAHRHFPANATYRADERPLLSWRVSLLPFIDRKLYDEFHHDEPWDSEHNRTLITRMPDLYKSPKNAEPGKTNYLGVVGPECFMTGTPQALDLRQMTDGTSHTFAIVEADKAVEWTRPDDWEFDRAEPLRGLGKLWNGNWFVGMVDGSVKRHSDVAMPEFLGIHFTRAGGETRSLADSAGRLPQEPRPEGQEIAPGSEGGRYSAEGMAVGVSSDAGVPATYGETFRGHEIFASIPMDVQGQYSTALYKAIRAADAAGVHVELMVDGDLNVDAQHARQLLIITPAPTEADWLRIVGEPPRKNRVIAEKAWHRLGLKVVPADTVEQFKSANGIGGAVKILGGNVPKGLPLPAYLVSVGDSGVLKSFDDLHMWLEGSGSNDDAPVRCSVVAASTVGGNEEFLIEGKSTTVPADGKPAARAPKVNKSSKDAAGEVQAAEATSPGNMPQEVSLELVRGADDKAGLVFEGKPIDDEALRKLIEDRNGPGDRVSVSLAADPSISYREVSRVVEQLKALRVERMTLRGGQPGATSTIGGKTAGEREKSPKMPKRAPFPSLEEQKLADLTWKRLGLELTPLDEEQMKLVRAKGYDGGMWVAQVQFQNQHPNYIGIQEGDLLVGLHVWPTQNLNDVATVLRRDDLAEFSPLKFYVLRSSGGDDADRSQDEVREVVGRIAVSREPSNVSGRREQSSSTSKKRDAVAATPQDALKRWLMPNSQNTRPAATEWLSGSAPSLHAQVPQPTSSSQFPATEERKDNALPRPYIPQATISGNAPSLPIGVPTAPAQPYFPNAATSVPAPELLIPTTSIPAWRASAEKIELLRQYVDTLKEQFDRVNALEKSAKEGGSRLEYETAAGELAAAEGELALGQNDRAGAIRKYKDAKLYAERAVETVKAAEKAGEARPREVFDAVKNLLAAKRKLLQVEREQSSGWKSAASADAWQSVGPVTAIGIGDPATPPIRPAIPPTHPLAPTPAAGPIQPALELEPSVASGPTPASAPEAAVPLSPLPALAPALDPSAPPTEPVLLYGEIQNATTGPAPDLMRKVSAGEGALLRNQRSALRYQDKTFDDWRDSWRNELSIQKRLDAVKALAAFGANGYGREAAEAIVEVAGQYDWRSKAKTIQDLEVACTDALGGTGGTLADAVPAAEAVPVLLQASKSKNKSTREFVADALRAHISQDERAAEAVIELSKDADKHVRLAAWTSIQRILSPERPALLARTREALRGADIESQVAALEALKNYLRAVAADQMVPSDWDYLPELEPLLLSKDERVRRYARSCVPALPHPSAKQLVEDMQKIIEDSSRTEDRRAAILAMAATGKATKVPEDVLKQILHGDDESLSIAAAVALRRHLEAAEFNFSLHGPLSQKLGIRVEVEGRNIISRSGGDKRYQDFVKQVDVEEGRLYR